MTEVKSTETCLTVILIGTISCHQQYYLMLMTKTDYKVSTVEHASVILQVLWIAMYDVKKKNDLAHVIYVTN